MNDNIETVWGWSLCYRNIQLQCDDCLSNTPIALIRDGLTHVWSWVKWIGGAHSGVILIILIAVITVIIDTHNHAQHNFGRCAIKSSWEGGGVRLVGLLRRAMKMIMFQHTRGHDIMIWQDDKMMMPLAGRGSGGVRLGWCDELSKCFNLTLWYGDIMIRWWCIWRRGDRGRWEDGW